LIKSVFWAFLGLLAKNLKTLKNHIWLNNILVVKYNRFSQTFKNLIKKSKFLKV
jgi:hypothetical protein